MIDARATRGRRRTTARQSAASGPNSGPTTIAPTIRTAESVRIPTAAIIVAIAMNRTYVAERSVLSRTFCSTCSQSTASADDPGARSIAARARAETDASTASIAIEPSR